MRYGFTDKGKTYPMHYNRLADFREQLFASFLQAGDTLLNLVDALAAETPAHSLAELSLSPFFPRQWGSLYQGLQRARIDRASLRKLFASVVSAPEPATRLVLGIDASSILRPCSQTARDRTYVHASNLPEGSRPVAPGWQFSTLVVLPETPSCWTFVLDNLRVVSEKTQGETAAEQLKAVLPLLSVRPLLLGDGYYGSVAFLGASAALPCDFLLRLAKNRVLYRPAPPRPQKPGRGQPRKDGAAFACHRPDTHGEPDARWEGSDALGQPLHVCVWKRLHWKRARQIEVSVIRVVRPHAAETERDPRTSWFVFEGDQLPPLGEIADLYRRRYGQEHGYRADKQTLMWDTPRLRTPDGFQTWTDVVAATRNLLFLARPLATEARQPWENKRRELSLSQVRRAMGRILAQLPPLTRPVKPRGKSPGRAEGAKIGRATRYKVVYKAKTKTEMKIIFV